MAGEALGPGTARVYWRGLHAKQRLHSPLGKLHSEGLKLLRESGWEEVANDDPRVPGFAFTTRKGADFPATGIGLPKVRQLPQACSALLDDKRLLAECLAAAGRTHIAPRTWTDLDAFLQQRGDRSAGGSSPRSSTASYSSADAAVNSSGNSGKADAASGSSGGSPAAPSGPPTAQEQLWFLKHRHGVKGQAVYAFTALPPLLERLRSLGGSSSGSGGARQHFILQQGVVPPLLLPDGRKFTLRAHVLLLLQQGPQKQQQQQQQQGWLGEVVEPQQGEREEPPPSAQQQPSKQPAQQQQREAPQQLQVFVHEDIIVTPHAKPALSSSSSATEAAPPAAPLATAAAATPPAAPADADPAVHISSRGRNHPRPFLLSQLSLVEQQPGSGDEALRQELWQQVCGACCAAVAAAAPRGLAPSGADPQAVFCPLFAFDLAVAAATPTTAAAALEPAPELQLRSTQQQQQQQLHPTRHRPPQHAGTGAPAVRVLLLEANSYPAIASGTMAAVQRSIYTRLVGDMLSLAVLPALGGEAPRAGGFHRVLSRCDAAML